MPLAERKIFRRSELRRIRHRRRSPVFPLFSWNYGKDALRNFKKYDSLRYALLPYIYSNAYRMNQTGEPLMKALVFDYQDDINVYETGDQFLFGNSLMVCPVTTKGALTDRKSVV